MAKPTRWDFQCRSCDREFTLVGDDFEFTDVTCYECKSDDLELIGYDFAEYERYLEKLLRKKTKLESRLSKKIGESNFIDIPRPGKHLLN